MVGAFVLNIIINIFFTHTTMVNYQENSAFGQVALKWLSNTLCKLLLYFYHVCASRNNSDKTAHMHRQIKFFTVYLFNERQLFISWFKCFSFLVYKLCTAIMHIQN